MHSTEASLPSESMETQRVLPGRSLTCSPNATSQHFVESGNLSYTIGAKHEELQLPVQGYPGLTGLRTASSSDTDANLASQSLQRSKRRRLESPRAFKQDQSDVAEIQPSIISAALKSDAPSILPASAPTGWPGSENMLNDAALTLSQAMPHWIHDSGNDAHGYEELAHIPHVSRASAAPYVSNENVPPVWQHPPATYDEEPVHPQTSTHAADRHLERSIYMTTNQFSNTVPGHYGIGPFFPPPSALPNQSLGYLERLDTNFIHSSQENLQAGAPGHFATQMNLSHLPADASQTVPGYSPLRLALPAAVLPAGFLPGQGAESFPPYEIVSYVQKGSKRGPFKDPLLRERTAMTRKIGCCIRCKIQRVRCEPPEQGGPGAPCATCQRTTNVRAANLPCMRSKISDVKVGKPGQVPGYQWSRRWNHNISDSIQEWASTEIKMVIISDVYGYGSFRLPVRQFVPQVGDKLDRSWDYRGTKRSVVVPAYALVSLHNGKDIYSRYINACKDGDFSIRLGSDDEFLRSTYAEARKLMRKTSDKKKRDLLSRTFKLWMAIRLSTSSEFIVGEETLGMPRDILDDTSPNRGRIPVPPVLGAQLDVILIHHIQAKLRREALSLLNEIVLQNKPKNWLCIYLVVFILLHNAAMITAHDAGYARKHGMKRRFAREAEVHDYADGANTLLAHFHYLNKGVLPFSARCSADDLQTIGQLDHEEVDFVMKTRLLASQRGQAWAGMREERRYEDDYYFISQLFEEKWQPRALSM